MQISIFLLFEGTERLSFLDVLFFAPFPPCVLLDSSTSSPESVSGPSSLSLLAASASSLLFFLLALLLPSTLQIRFIMLTLAAAFTVVKIYNDTGTGTEALLQSTSI
jgi:hypothetical protein